MRSGLPALIILFFTVGFLSAQPSDSGTSSWSMSVSPVFFAPLFTGDLEENEILGSSWGGSLITEYSLSETFPFAARLGLCYSRGSLLPVNTIEVDGYLDEVTAVFGAALGIRPAPAFSLRGYLDAGVSYGGVGENGTFYGVVRAGVDCNLYLTDSLMAHLATGGLYKFGLAGGFEAGLGMSYRFPAPKQKVGTALKYLEYSSLETTAVFPSLRYQYEENPVGYATIQNTGRKPLTDLKASFIISQYMDSPKECMRITKLEPGQTLQIPLYALFNDTILNITEATKVSGRIIVEHGGVEESSSTTVLVYDRNALTWSDDRKAAAFVSSKDPWVMDLTGNIMATVMPAKNPEVTENLQTAIALHEGLRAYGISYLLSPNRPFAQAVVDTSAVDSLKFPRQTLGFRAGDCADLSVLYASCFEAAGVQTAFVTVPGHIFVAVDLGITEAEALSRGMKAKDFIVQDDNVWLPLETTLRNGGFTEAWRKGADQWVKAAEAGVACLYPVHEAWEKYPPVGLPADGSSVRLPAPAEVLKGFTAELAAVVTRELSARLELLGPLGTGQSYTRGKNSRGVLYARYGFYPEALENFREAARVGSSSALVNLGNILMLQSDPEGAYEHYLKAAALLPRNPKLQVNLAQAAAACGKKAEAEAALRELRALDPEMADRYAYVAGAGEGSSSGQRAAAVENTVIWF
ncbi:MAG: hypothetical protein JW760_08095 [Spirochaetales bacterium]|nr:hypothetical protein [Spirochaetales bacterium]